MRLRKIINHQRNARFEYYKMRANQLDQQRKNIWMFPALVFIIVFLLSGGNQYEDLCIYD